MEPMLAEIGPIPRALDFGSGDGWFASQVTATARVDELTPIDVLRREGPLVEPVLYDGERLPFGDRHFPLSYAVDVLHHCSEPMASLQDVLRVTGKWFLLKDHTWTSLPGKYLLAALDRIGNRGSGVTCVYKHQRGWAWSETLRRAGFEQHRLVHPAPCHTGAMRLINRYEFVALWRRIAS